MQERQVQRSAAFSLSSLWRWGLVIVVVLFVGAVAGRLLRSHGTGRVPPVAPDGSPDTLDKMLPVVSFEEVPLKEALDHLSSLTNTPIYVDWNSIKPLGITCDQRISVRLRNVKFAKALKWTLGAADPAASDCHVEIRNDGTVFVTSYASYWHSNTEMRVYDTRDLYKDASPDLSQDKLAQQIVHLIEDTIAPDSWASAGGVPGAISDNGGFLIVRQTRENHQALRNLLSELRDTRAVQPPQSATVLPAMLFPQETRK